MKDLEELHLKMESNPLADDFPLSIDTEDEYILRVLPDEGILYITRVGYEGSDVEHYTWEEAATKVVNGKSLRTWARDAQINMFVLARALGQFATPRHEVERRATEISLAAVEDAVEEAYLDRYDEVAEMRDQAGFVDDDDDDDADLDDDFDSELDEEPAEVACDDHRVD